MAVPDLTASTPVAPAPGLGRRLPAGRAPLLVCLLGVHFLLAHAMAISPTIATLHAAATIAVVAWVSLFARRPEHLLVAAAYVVGAEVLWRQTAAALPWQASAYLLVAIFGVAVVRFSARPSRRLRMAAPIVYLVLLLPGCLATIGVLGFTGAQEQIGFYVAPALALGLGVLLDRQFWARWQTMRPILWALVLPIFGTLTIATTTLVGLSATDFLSEESNFAASGGFGPNQVSALLSAGVVACAFLALKERGWFLQLLCAGLALWFLVQSSLTYSRGGPANVAVAALLAAPHLLTRPGRAARTVAVAGSVFVVVVLLVLPRLQDFTGGTLESRLRSTDGNRVELAEVDLTIFRENIATGVGVGLSEERRGDGAGFFAAHTEYTRLLAEHGLFGAGALACLIAMAVSSYRRSRGMVARAFSAALIGWTAAEMTHAAMRLSATAFLFALAALAVVDDDQTPPGEPLLAGSHRVRRGPATP